MGVQRPWILLLRILIIIIIFQPMMAAYLDGRRTCLQQPCQYEPRSHSPVYYAWGFTLLQNIMEYFSFYRGKERSSTGLFSEKGAGRELVVAGSHSAIQPLRRFPSDLHFPMFSLGIRAFFSVSPPRFISLLALGWGMLAHAGSFFFSVEQKRISSYRVLHNICSNVGPSGLI